MKAWTLLLIDEQGMTTEVTSSFVSPAECSHAGSAWQTTMAVKGTKSMCIERSTSVKDTTTVIPAKENIGFSWEYFLLGLGSYVLGVITTKLWGEKK